MLQTNASHTFYEQKLKEQTSTVVAHSSADNGKMVKSNVQE
jgi:hypothetical protein